MDVESDSAAAGAGMAGSGKALVIAPSGEDAGASGSTDAGSGTAGSLTRQAENDTHLLRLWLYGRSLHTQRAYRYGAERFLAAVGKPLQQLTLGDVQAYAQALTEPREGDQPLAPSSQALALSAVKSLLSFGHRLGYLPFDVGGAMRLPRLKSTLAERILAERAVQRLLALEPAPRNHALLLLLYAAGLRVSEACALRWRDLQSRDGDGDEITGQVTVFGKGGKTRAVLLPASVWQDLEALREAATTNGEAAPDDNAPVFRSRKGGALDPSQVRRIVDAAARRAGLRAGKGGVSPHWLRHAHATHALERQAPIHIVQATLGHASVATTGRYLHARPTDSSARYLAV